MKSLLYNVIYRGITLDNCTELASAYTYHPTVWPPFPQIGWLPVRQDQTAKTCAIGLLMVSKCHW